MQAGSFLSCSYCSSMDASKAADTEPTIIMTSNKPQTVEQYEAKLREMVVLLVECRDAITAIPLTAVRLGRVSGDLDRRIEACLKPWEVDANHPGAI